MDLLKVLAVGIGGFFGAMLRYVISVSTSTYSTHGIPIGTLLVNVLGGFLIGFIYTYADHTQTLSPHTRLFLTTGILGGLTTFSTFSYETIGLFEESSYTLAILNIGLNLILSLLGVILGKYSANLFFS